MNFSYMVRPPTDLSKKNIALNWGPLCQVGFDTIKITLTKSPIFILPDPNEPYVLFTDSSKHSWSGVPTQERITNINGKDMKSF